MASSGECGQQQPDRCDLSGAERAAEAVGGRVRGESNEGELVKKCHVVTYSSVLIISKRVRKA